MVYSNKFVMCVLLNGRPQKELANGVVSLPFGTEYALRFRNKNNRRAVVHIYIDGEDVSGGGYIIEANDFVDIKRLHDIDRAFKFVSLDSEDAIDYGKDGPNHDKVKGTIEARFSLEKERQQVIYRDVHHDHHHHHDHYYPRPRPLPYYPPPSPIWIHNDSSPTYRSKPDGMMHPTGGGGMSSGQIKSDMMLGGCDSGIEMSCDSGQQDLRKSSLRRTKTTLDFSGEEETKTCSLDVATFKRISLPEPLQDGCTVEGYSTGQRFHTVHIDLEESETVLKLFLQGYEEEERPVRKSRRPAKKARRKTNRDLHIDDLQDENDKLKDEIEDLKNKKYKKKLEDKQEKNLKDDNENLKKELEELKEE